MPSKGLRAEGTSYEWNSGGDASLTTASLAADAGRQGAEYDRGSGDLDPWVRFFLYAKFNAAPTVGDPIIVAIFAHDDTSHRPALLSASDAALGGSSDNLLREALHQFRAEAGTTTASNKITATSPPLFIPQRYVIPVIFNVSGNQVLSSTEADCGLVMRPFSIEAQ